MCKVSVPPCHVGIWTPSKDVEFHGECHKIGALDVFSTLCIAQTMAPMLQRCPCNQMTVQTLQVQLVCSPDAEVYMLVREPETCRYVVTLYHPSICSIQGYQHHQEEQMQELMDLMASVAGGGHEEL